MKRRDFGLLAGTCLTTAALVRPANAQSAAPDPSQLTTTLTPMGAERAGNADGSIPAWTGGLTSPPLPANQPVGVHLFEDEQPLYTVDASNMAQYAHLLTPGTQAEITKFGLTLKVYQTHRTAAAPQYVYDNAAKNVTRAQLDPAGGRLGFTGGYGGPPFPIIDTSNPLTAGAQLVWNHLTAWNGYSIVTTLAPGCVVINGHPMLVSGTLSRSLYPYYDPNGTLETFDGYYSKAHYYYRAPAAVVGQEQLIWHSTNVRLNADIIWILINGEGRVRKAPNESFDAPNPLGNGIDELDEASCFYGNPEQYDWTFIEKKEMLVPYNCNAMLFPNVQNLLKPHAPDPEVVRWEKHRVWVVEANLHPGYHNVNIKRRFYADEDTWYFLLGEGYDGNGDMWKSYHIYNECVPSMPGVIEQATTTLNMLTGDYVFDGNSTWAPYNGDQYIEQQPASDFTPEGMAKGAAF